jgi:hypothetical protein
VPPELVVDDEVAEVETDVDGAETELSELIGIGPLPLP